MCVWDELFGQCLAQTVFKKCQFVVPITITETFPVEYKVQDG